MDSPAPPSDQVRHTQVGGGEIPVFQHLEHPEQSPYKGVTTRPSKGMKNTDKNVSLRKRTHRAESKRENIWKTDPRNAGRSSGRNDRSGSWPNERTAPPTTRNSVDEMSDDAFADMMKKYAAENFGSMFRRHCDMFGTVNSHSNNHKEQFPIKSDVRMSRRKRTMAACLCRHMKDVLFSNTSVTMAERDRKSYFDRTDRLLGKCSYAQNLALFYILYVRKKVNCTAESLSTQTG